MIIVWIVIIILLAASLRWPWWLPKNDGLAVLVYHKIGRPPKNSRLKQLWVKPEKFEKQVKHLLAKGYKTVTFCEVAEHAGDENWHRNKVLITFDDGYENNREAYKILKKLGAKGNIFVVFNTVGKVNSWHDPETEPWINMAGAGQLLEMKESGVMEFGAHTMNHPPLSSLDEERAAWEIAESKRQLEKLLSVKIVAFACPYGDGAHNPKIRKKIFSAGFALDFSFRQGKTPWPWNREKEPIDRLFIKGGDTMADFRLHLSKGRTSPLSPKIHRIRVFQ